jgi:hypothetical protein
MPPGSTIQEAACQQQQHIAVTQPGRPDLLWSLHQPLVAITRLVMSCRHHQDAVVWRSQALSAGCTALTCMHVC